MLATLIAAKTLTKKEYFFRGKNLLITTKPPSITNGYIGGYMKKASLKFPCTSNHKLRCPPQPGQSKPKKLLVRQGSINSSIAEIYSILKQK